MTFLNPLILLGLIASGIPIVLHLLNLRKMKPIEFSTIRFLEELRKTNIKKIKLKQLLLLLLRVLLIAFTVLAFSRPTIQSNLPIIGTHAKTSAIIILDNSASMDISDNSGNRLIQAKNTVRSIVSQLREGDEAVLLTVNSGNGESKENFSTNFALILDQTSSTIASPAPFLLESLLRKAQVLLNNTTNISKEIYIVTDAQKSSWTLQEDSLSLFDKFTGVFFLPIGGDATAISSNIAIDSVSIASRIIQKNRPVDVDVVLRNDSDRDAIGVAVGMLFNERRVAQRSVDIPAKSTKTIVLSGIPLSGGITGVSVTLEPDAFDADNVRYCSFLFPEKLRIGVFASASIANYLTYALSAAAVSGLDVEFEQYEPSDLLARDLQVFDVVVLANGVAAPAEAGKLQSFLAEGKGAFVFADPSIPFAVQQQFLNRLGIEVLEEMRPDQGQNIFINKKHPMLSGIFKKNKSAASDGKELTENLAIKTMRPALSTQSVLTIDLQSLLSIHSVDEGTLIYCSVPPTPEWSQITRSTLFPAIVLRGSQYSAQRETHGKQTLAGEEYTLKLPKKFAAGGVFPVDFPDASQKSFSAAVTPSGSVLSFGTVSQTGNYKVYGENRQSAESFSVNISSIESQFDQPTSEEIQEYFAEILSPGVSFSIIEKGKNVASNVALARTGTELWKACVALALVCAALEMAVAKSKKNESVDI